MDLSILNNLSKEEKARLLTELEAEKRAEKERIEQERSAYRDLKDEAIRDMFKELTEISNRMQYQKALVFDRFVTIIEMKDNLYKTKSDRMSNSFTTEDGSITIKLGHRINEGWSDVMEVGVAKVKDYLKTLARDDNSAALVDAVMGLLTKDRKGNLKASRVLELEKLAQRSGNPDFIEGINIIKESYRPSPTCRFIEVKFRDENNKERSLPLSMSTIDVNDND